MPVDSKHPLYLANIERWTRCRDCIEGSDAVKDKKEIYLPKLSKQSIAEYDAYRKRANFVGIADRSLTGMVGMMTRRTPTIVKPDEMEPYFEDSSNTGVSFSELYRYTAEEILMMGRFVLVLDRAPEGGRQYIATYQTESFINWLEDEKGQLIMAMFQESNYEPKADDKYELEEVIYFREFIIDNGEAKVNRYRQNTKSKAELINTYTLSLKGEVLDYLPIVVVSPVGINNTIHKPPIQDIVDINLSHYRTSADLENGRHYVALPTPIVSGASGSTELHIGSTTAWVLPEKDAKAYYLEFIGQGLGSLENALAEKQAQMSQFSTRLMDTTTRGSEAAETVRLRHSSEAATLTSVTNSIESAFNVLYGTIASNEGFDEVKIDLNKDFLETKLSAADLKALVEAYLEDTIDQETFLYNLERGELTIPGHTMTVKPPVENTDDA